jgi:F0F1-type ATP synthase membrane subunit b/b'
MNEEYYRNIYMIKDEDTLTLSGKHLREFKEFIRKETKQEILEIIDDYKKDMKNLKGNKELTFEEHINNIKQKVKGGLK